MSDADAVLNVSEQTLDVLFTPGSDPYRAAAVVLFDKPADAITQDDRDIVKRVFMRTLKRYRERHHGENQVLRDAADTFHRIGAALNAERLLSREDNKLTTPLLEALVSKKLSTHDLIKAAADGFELCVRALAEMGASDVMIHECGERDFEEHW